MITTKPRKYPPKEDRADNLKQTLISAISHKLNRMDIDQLREVYQTAARLLQGQK